MAHVIKKCPRLLYYFLQFLFTFIVVTTESFSAFPVFGIFIFLFCLPRPPAKTVPFFLRFFFPAYGHPTLSFRPLKHKRESFVLSFSLISHRSLSVPLRVSHTTVAVHLSSSSRQREKEKPVRAVKSKVVSGLWRKRKVSPPLSSKVPSKQEEAKEASLALRKGPGHMGHFSTPLESEVIANWNSWKIQLG